MLGRRAVERTGQRQRQGRRRAASARVHLSRLSAGCRHLAPRVLRRRRQVPPRHHGRQAHHGDEGRHPPPHHRALPDRHPQRPTRARHRNGLTRARLGPLPIQVTGPVEGTEPQRPDIDDAADLRHAAQPHVRVATRRPQLRSQATSPRRVLPLAARAHRLDGARFVGWPDELR